jgi:hypothetical protein
MDAIVEQAMAKWPNVPHCYGWLALDARGAWRMRDERAQTLGLAGDKIVHPALLAFINRNYAADADGCWFFQNGPQRVYVDLEVAPYIAHTDPAHGFVLHTGQVLSRIEAVWMTDDGLLLLQGEGNVALLDDRDLAACLPCLQMNGLPVSDEALQAWLEGRASAMGALVFACRHQQADGSMAVQHPVQAIRQAALTSHFGFIRTPRATALPHLIP